MAQKDHLSSKSLKDEFYVNPESDTEEWTPGK